MGLLKKEQMLWCQIMLGVPAWSSLLASAHVNISS